MGIPSNEPLPSQIRDLAGIQPGEIDRSNRSQLLPRYQAAERVLRLGGTCLQFGATEDPCVDCRNDDPEQRLCQRFKILRALANNEGETVI